jgi:hypothetical protein
MALGGKPGKIVVAHDGEVEAGFLRAGRIADQFLRAGLLGHQGVAKACHHCPLNVFDLRTRSEWP